MTHACNIKHFDICEHLLAIQKLIPVNGSADSGKYTGSFYTSLALIRLKYGYGAVSFLSQKHTKQKNPTANYSVIYQ